MGGVNERVDGGVNGGVNRGLWACLWGVWGTLASVLMCGMGQK